MKKTGWIEPTSLRLMYMYYISVFYMNIIWKVAY